MRFLEYNLKLFKITHLFAAMKGKKTLSINEAFEQAQKPHQNHVKLVNSLKHTYNKVNKKLRTVILCNCECLAKHVLLQ